MEIEVVWRRQVANLLDRYVDGNDSVVVCRLNDIWGVPNDTVRSVLRKIKGKSKKPFVEINLVDGLAIAIGRPEAFHLGEIRVMRKHFSGQGQVQKQVLWKPEPRKKCPGPLCKGKQRPLKEFYVYKSGRKAGRVYPHCKKCSATRGIPYRETYKRRHRKHQEWVHFGNTPIEKVVSDLEYLCSKLGPLKTAELIGISYHSVWKWRKRLHTVIRKEYAMKVKQVVEEVRNGNGSKT